MCLQSLRWALHSFKASLGAAPADEEGTGGDISQPSRRICLPDYPQIDRGAIGLFNCAFVFCGCSNSVDEHVVPATLMYNMGLCHHQRALRQGDHTRGLKAAYLAYSHGLTLLNAVSGELRNSDMVLVAALANNMANISSLVSNINSVRLFRQILDDVMETTDLDGFGDDDAYAFFSLNLMLVSDIQLHALAPAA